MSVKVASVEPVVQDYFTEKRIISKPEDFAWVALEYIRELAAQPLFEGTGFSGVAMRPIFIKKWKDACEGRRF